MCMVCRALSKEHCGLLCIVYRALLGSCVSLSKEHLGLLYIVRLLFIMCMVCRALSKDIEYTKRHTRNTKRDIGYTKRYTVSEP